MRRMSSILSALIRQHVDQCDRAKGDIQATWLFPAILATAYCVLFGALLITTKGLPYVMDNNESFSSLIHAQNLYHFELSKSAGLTDEAYGPNPEAHPYVHSHQGNFPRIFAFLIYCFGARTIESQIVVTTFTVGLGALFLVFYYFSRTTNPSFALITCLIFVSDYLFFAQWHVVTYRVWHSVFIFSSLLCIHGMGGSKRQRLWCALTFLNYLCLFYFELVFAFFVVLFSSLYALGLYSSAWASLRRTWIWQFAGAAAGGLLLVAQLVLYMGVQNTLTDAYLTFKARNLLSDSVWRTEILDFYNNHNLVFWENYMDASHLRTFRAFVDSFFSGHFQVLTPVFSLLILLLASGWFLGLWSSVGRTKKFGSEWTASLEDFRWLVPLSRFAILYVPAYFLIKGILRGAPFLETKVQSAGISYGLMTGLAVVLAFFGCLLLLKVSTHGWFSVWRLPLLNTCVAGAFMFVWSVLFRKYGNLYDGFFQPFWAEIIDSWFLMGLKHLALFGAVGLAVIMILKGTSKVLGRLNNQSLPGLPRYLICGLLAYGLVYVIFTGYTYSGYLRRFAPFFVFFINVLISLAVYVALKTVFPAGRRAILRGRSWLFRRKGNSFGGAQSRNIRPEYFESMIPKRFLVVIGRSVSVFISSLLITSLSLFLLVYWFSMQLTYLELFPPDHFSFLKNLKEPRYQGASFASSGYAAPIAATTGNWAYIDPSIGSGKIDLTSSGFEFQQDLTNPGYRWFADKKQNPTYRRPDYYLSLVFPTFHHAMEHLVHRVGAKFVCRHHGKTQLSEYPKFASNIGIVINADQNQGILSHRVVNRDKSERDNWAILKLDWDFPPYLRSQDGLPESLYVKLHFAQIKGRQAVRVEYSYAHQEDKAESGSKIRLFAERSNGSMLLADESSQQNWLVLPAEFSGKIQASVTPSTHTKVGSEYFSQIIDLKTKPLTVDPRSSVRGSKFDRPDNAKSIEARDLNWLSLSSETLPDPAPRVTVIINPPDDRYFRAGSKVLTDSGNKKLLQRGDIIFTDQRILRIEQDRTRSLVGYDGQVISLDSVKYWNNRQQRNAPLLATFRGGRWLVDGSQLTPMNLNPMFEEGSHVNPAPGWSIQPGDKAAYVISMKDEAGPFIRVRARRDTEFLSLIGSFLLSRQQLDPVVLQVKIRTRGGGAGVQVLELGTCESGFNQNTYRAEAKSDSDWQTLLVLGSTGTPSDKCRNLSFRASLFNVREGDSFDIRNFWLSLGRPLPTASPKEVPPD